MATGNMAAMNFVTFNQDHSHLGVGMLQLHHAQDTI
jgi:hypothetical protein